MPRRKYLLLLCGLAAILHPVPALAQPDAQAAELSDRSAAAVRDGQRDFDFEIGTWRTHVRRLGSPLSGSTEWVEYEGTSIVRALLGGRANQVELSVEGPAGRIEGVSLRLYDPQSRRWSIHYASMPSGALGPPVVGGFSDGRGEFYGPDTFDGREVLVRFVISDIRPDSIRFEQAFSADGGATWEVNWIATDIRL